MFYKMLFIPIISAFIGYATNVLAIRLLFWPREPVNFGLFKMQGLLPKRQNDIAVKVGELVETELLSVDDVLDKVNTPEVQEKMVSKISEIAREKLAEVLPRMLPPKITGIIADNIEKMLRAQAPALTRQLFSAGRDYLTEEIQISKIVEEKINDYDLKELEDIIRGVSITELTFIEILGGVVGFIIGIVQLLIMMWLFPV